MNKNVFKVLIPVVAVLIIGESIMLMSKATQVEPKIGPVALKPATNQPVTLKWDVPVTSVKTGVVNELPLMISSDKDVFIDALDLYVNYDSSKVEVTSATSTKFVNPSFKKINAERGIVVMNFLVSENTGFALKKGQPVEVAKLNVNYLKEGDVEFSLGEATLVVENGSAKVLPFNSEKLVINVSR